MLGCITKADRLGRHPTGKHLLQAALTVHYTDAPAYQYVQSVARGQGCGNHCICKRGAWGKVSLKKVDRHRRIFLTSTSLLVPNRQCRCGSEFPRADRQNDGFLACALPQCLSPPITTIQNSRTSKPCDATVVTTYDQRPVPRRLVERIRSSIDLPIAAQPAAHHSTRLHLCTTTAIAASAPSRAPRLILARPDNQTPWRR